jgi:hypothetical protein
MADAFSVGQLALRAGGPDDGDPCSDVPQLRLARLCAQERALEHFDLERTRRTLSDSPATNKRQANEMMQDILRSVAGVVA